MQSFRHSINIQITMAKQREVRICNRIKKSLDQMSQNLPLFLLCVVMIKYPIRETLAIVGKILEVAIGQAEKIL